MIIYTCVLAFFRTFQKVWLFFMHLKKKKKTTMNYLKSSNEKNYLQLLESNTGRPKF